jgi:hypothetical protein
MGIPAGAVKRIKVRKIDAATGQLDTAIELWFREKDFASILTLSAAAHEIIAAIVAHQKLGETLFDSMVFREEFRKQANKAFREPQNFLKHADHDPDPNGTFEVWAEHPAALMMFCLVGLERLKVRKNAHRAAFFVWYMIHHPDHLTEEGRTRIGAHIGNMKKSLGAMEADEFFDSFVSAFPMMNWRS